jgi:hypothetical protein|tara:strand:+ start:418 stop:801 length:384 start_codon:yes stop_codon:yes gene_type:complete
MAGFSDYLENKVLSYVFSGGSFSQPGTKYLALYTTAPTDAGGGTELSGSAYARQSCAFTTTGAQASNTSAVEWPTATGSWGTVVAVGVFDASSSGNLLAWNNLTASKTISTGDVFRINAGDLDIDLD